MTFTEDDARRRDEADPGHRELFHIPAGIAYFAGNSLGLQPKATVPELLSDLDDWARLGVEGHLEGGRPWLPYHELLTGPAARGVLGLWGGGGGGGFTWCCSPARPPGWSARCPARRS